MEFLNLALNSQQIVYNYGFLDGTFVKRDKLKQLYLFAVHRFLLTSILQITYFTMYVECRSYGLQILYDIGDTKNDTL